MLKKGLLIFLLIIGVLSALIGWRFFMSNTNFEESSRYLYIYTGAANPDRVLGSLRDSGFLRNPESFDLIAGRMKVWDRIKPGRYEIKKGMSLFDLARVLRNGKQAPVNLVITKLRTREQFASLVGKKFECDSLHVVSFLNSPDSLKKYNLDTNTVMTAVFPDTYTYNWNSDPGGIFEKLYAHYKRIWTPERLKLAEERGLNPASAYTLASIIEEETNLHDEKDTMASVYLNRIRKNMRLGADPTVKFALRDFGLRRIYNKHLTVESPYNTYRYAGLPPGPICTPSLITLDKVLNSPKTNYLYFVASSDFSKRHVFTENYSDHMKYAREYQKALNELQKKKQAKAAEDLGK